MADKLLWFRRHHIFKQIVFIMYIALISLFICYIYSIILESDPMSVTQRVNFRTSEDIPLGEQTVAQVMYNIHIIYV